MKKLMKKIKQVSILILAITFLGCHDDEVNLPKVVSGFTYTIDIDNGVVRFINISENATNFSWDFGDGTTSTLINPVKTYPNGTYTVVLTATNVAGDSNTFEDVITIAIPQAATIPITFDDENTTYDATVFNGATFSVVDNPDSSGANTSTGVGSITNSGAAYEGFFFELGSPIDLSVNKTVKVLFWSDKAVDVLLKLEDGTADNVEVTASHSGTGWEVLYFTFDSAASYSKFTMFVDGPGTTAGTFYIDDITQIASDTIPCLETNLVLPIDFDCNGIAYIDKIVGNVSFEVIDNPELSGINSETSKVGKITNVGANWENAFFNLDTAIDFATDKGVKLKLFSNQALTIKLKFEDGTEAPIEADVEHTGSGWEELTFSYTSSASYNDMILFVDGPGTAAGTFYVDDIEQVAVTPPTTTTCTETMLALPIDFDCETIDYESKRIPGDIGFSIIDNPQVNGINNVVTKVGQITNIGNNWENLNFKLDTAINFSTDKSIKLKLYSTQALPIKLKVEGGGTPVEDDQNHTGSGWEELTFTLQTAESFTNIVIFIDGPGNATGTFYIDDIEHITSGTTPPPPPTGDCPAPPAGELLANGDFEAGSSCWQLFSGTSISTTVSNGGSNSLEMQGAAGVAVNFKQERFAIGIVEPNTSYTVTFDIIADGPLGEGGLFKAFAFSEGADGGTVPATLHTLTDNTTTLATTWETKTYTFTTAPNANQVEGGISFLLELVNSTAKLNVDNIVIKKAL